MPETIGEKAKKAIRERNFEWHCHEIVLYQPALDDGYELKGYGTIKSSKTGGLYLTFVCMSANKKIAFGSPIPIDALDTKQCVEMRGTTIDGLKISSQQLKIDTRFSQKFNDGPKLFVILLRTVEILGEENSESKIGSFLLLEFNESPGIPLDMPNTTESSTGFFSTTLNQAKIVNDKFEINIIRHRKFTEVSAKSSDLDSDAIRNAVLFYIGFSSGQFVQPYYEYFREQSCSKTRMNSIDAGKNGRRIPPPIPDNAHDENGKSLAHIHHDLLKKILIIACTKKDHFESVYSQWTRIWHSFLSPERNVTMLSVSVAVEGVLSDIFIPVIRELNRDDTFENKKREIIGKISCIADISNEHLESIEAFIQGWGKVSPKKALRYLEKLKIIEKSHSNNWESLRNSSTHPKLLNQDEARLRKDYEQMIVCLGLFYRLVLNVFEYRGAHFTYKSISDGNSVIYNYVKLL